MKRVGDDGAIGKSERRAELSIDLGEQHGVRRGCGAIELGESCERPPISQGPEAKHHGPGNRNRPRWLGSAVREPVSVGSSAEVVRF
jgi:hypothetical protein